VKKSDIVIIISILLVLAIVILGPYFIISVNWEYTLLSQTDPSGNFEVLIKYSEPFIFSPHDIIIYLKTKDMHFFNTVCRLSLYNDGKNLNENNVVLNWENTYLEVILKGEEQGDESVRISLDTLELIKN
jgi:hypothetical protein